jgi:hypothetical protein
MVGKPPRDSRGLCQSGSIRPSVRLSVRAHFAQVHSRALTRSPTWHHLSTPAVSRKRIKRCVPQASEKPAFPPEVPNMTSRFRPHIFTTWRTCSLMSKAGVESNGMNRLRWDNGEHDGVELCHPVGHTTSTHQFSHCDKPGICGKCACNITYVTCTMTKRMKLTAQETATPPQRVSSAERLNLSFYEDWVHRD